MGAGYVAGRQVTLVWPSLPHKPRVGGKGGGIRDSASDSAAKQAQEQPCLQREGGPGDNIWNI